MFDSVNKAIRACIEAARYRPHGGTPPLRKGERRPGSVRQLAQYAYRATIAAELLTFAPIEDAGGLSLLMSHLIVIRAELRLESHPSTRPRYSKRLVMALHNLIREVEQLEPVAASYSERLPRYGVA
jgi:hypothetical protein